MSDGDRAQPARLGRYEIVAKLASGGMGEVFIARSVGPGGFVKPVVVKRIHPHLASDPQFVQMLFDEANLTAAAQHPNIVATLDVGSEGNDHFLILDYVAGDPISVLLREMKQRSFSMPPWVVAFIGAQIASALHAAHEARGLSGEALGIVHREVSAGNILLADSGRPVLVDFGVAKARRKMHQTAQGELKGKLPYMAPEMFEGAEVTRAVDIFSLGVVLYEMLTNVSPFRRKTDIEMIMALKEGNVPRPSELRAGIDAQLDSIVLTALARDRAQRWPTAAKIEEALRGWARASGVAHEPAPVAEWLAWAFPERVEARKALLARVASPTQLPPPSSGTYRALTSGTFMGGGPSGPSSTPLPGVAQQRPTGPSGVMPPSMRPSMSPSMPPSSGGPSAPRHLPSPALIAAAPPARGRWALWAAVAVGATVVGGLLAYLLVERSGAFLSRRGEPASEHEKPAATGAASPSASTNKGP
ncbi:MAG: serine/threonine-protein kinase [Minicystis sp.]